MNLSFDLRNTPIGPICVGLMCGVEHALGKRWAYLWGACTGGL